MTTTRRLFTTFSLAAASLLALGQAQAQPSSYPSKPIRWVVGYPAGGGTDFLARLGDLVGAALSRLK